MRRGKETRKGATFSQSDRGELSSDSPYIWSLKQNDTNELTYKTETDSQTSRRHLLLSGGRMGGRDIVRQLGMDMYTLLYLKWITNKDLLSSTRNSAQRYVAAWMGGEFRGDGFICVYS